MTNSKRSFFTAPRPISTALTRLRLRHKLKRQRLKLRSHFDVCISNAIKERRAIFQKNEPNHEWLIAAEQSLEFDEPIAVVYNSLDKTLRIICRPYFAYNYCIANIDRRLHAGNIKMDERPGHRIISRFEWGQIRNVWFQLLSEMTSATHPSATEDAESAAA